jgi:hypothetical protein
MLLSSGARERKHPPVGSKWQSCAATHQDLPDDGRYVTQS